MRAVIDVKKANLNGKLGPDEVAFVQFSGSRPRLYGMRQAAAWEREFVEKLDDTGMVSGRSSPTVFHDPKTGARAVVQGDAHSWSGCGLESMSKGLDTPRIREESGNDEDDEGTRQRNFGPGPAREPGLRPRRCADACRNQRDAGTNTKDRLLSLGTSKRKRLREASSFREESSKVEVQLNLRWLCPAEKRSTARW